MNTSVNTELPLCVDCDGTLLRTDLLLESFVQLLKQSPISIFLLPLWLMRGKAYLKTQIAERVRLDVSILPYREELVEFLTQERARGRKLVLATGSAGVYAQQIADHLGLFDAIEATSAEHNLTGSRKAARLQERFQDGFVYAGDSDDDVPVWQAAAGAITVCSDAMQAKVANAGTPIEKSFAKTGPGLLDYIKAVRLHQWVKNSLIFVPLFAAHQFLNMELVFNAVLAFVAFGLCASSVYVLNDLLDLPADRVHPTKCLRPFASAKIPLQHALLMLPPLLLASLVITLFLPPLFGAVLAGYFAITLAYSMFLKSRVLVDVLTLATLYTTRILAGSAATNIEPSFWLLAFSMFVFLSLAVVKRVSELNLKMSHAEAGKGRGYRAEDMPILLGLGMSSGLVSVLVMALYVSSPNVSLLYGYPQILWLALPLHLYWITRVWMKTHRGEMHEDPIVFAVRDRTSRIIAVLLGLLLGVASLY